eukprot:scaffold267393_cov16-Prasinocladus_malaysianus.AAC.1
MFVSSATDDDHGMLSDSSSNTHAASSLGANPKRPNASLSVHRTHERNIHVLNGDGESSS